MTRILAIDPGPMTSGLVILDVGRWPPDIINQHPEASMYIVLSAISELSTNNADAVVVESIVPYLGRGGAIGQSTLDTAEVIGWIACTAAMVPGGIPVHRLSRPEVCRSLCPSCGRSTATSAQVAESIRDIYRRAGRATGGGADPTRGTQRQPGPLHGLALSSHAGSALAVGLAWLLQWREGR